MAFYSTTIGLYVIFRQSDTATRTVAARQHQELGPDVVLRPGWLAVRQQARRRRRSSRSSGVTPLYNDLGNVSAG